MNFQNSFTSTTNVQVNKQIANVFGWMSGGVIISAVTAVICQLLGLEYLLWSNWVVPLILVILEFALVLGMSWMMDKISILTMKIFFIVYSIVTGITFDSLTLAYTNSSIVLAFLITAVYFIALTVIGYTTKVDLSKWGTVLVIGLFAIIIAEVILLFFPIPMMERIITAAGLLLFSGMTAYDTQMMKRDLSQDQDPKWVIFWALSLYIDFINLFIRILELIGDSNENR